MYIGLASILTNQRTYSINHSFLINRSKLTVLVIKKYVYLFSIIFICVTYKILVACQIHYLKNQLYLNLLLPPHICISEPIHLWYWYFLASHIILWYRMKDFCFTTSAIKSCCHHNVLHLEVQVKLINFTTLNTTNV